MKVIFIAYADRPESHLDELRLEEDMVTEILTPGDLAGDFHLHRLPHATLESINRTLETFSDNLAIFMYSGHASEHSLLASDQQVYANGIALQLQKSADCGALKLVILNGCSTYGQVSDLRAAHVPVIVSTSAPVGDRSAKEFAGRFWRNLVRYNKTIEQAFSDALNPAQAATTQEVAGAAKRGLDIDPAGDRHAPLWKLDASDPAAVKVNPIPYREDESEIDYTPNQLLFNTLYDEFYESGNPEIVKLRNSEMAGDLIEKNKKEFALVNSIPYPIGKHLQVLFCKVDDKDGCDKIGFNRIRQIGRLFQCTTEFMGFIMLAQIWELALKFPEIKITETVKGQIRDYLSLAPTERDLFKYIPLIKSIRLFFERQRELTSDIRLFVDEQDILKDMSVSGEEFADACEYLWTLWYNIGQGWVPNEKLKYNCLVAESQLCVFFRYLGFIHHYYLTSVQRIDILKYRHISRTEARYKHRIIRLMQATGGEEHFYYLMPTFLDNWGVILIKGELKLEDPVKKIFSATALDFLNLSPFVIDKNAFYDKSSLSNLMFFKHYSTQDKKISFKNVANPENPRDELNIDQQAEYEPVRLEFEAFRDMIYSKSLIPDEKSV